MTDWELCKNITLLWKIRYQVMQAKFCSRAIQHELKRRETLNDPSQQEERNKITAMIEENRECGKIIEEMEAFIPTIQDVEKQMQELQKP